jgi:hypothetical protein
MHRGGFKITILSWKIICLSTITPGFRAAIGNNYHYFGDKKNYKQILWIKYNI